MSYANDVERHLVQGYGASVDDTVTDTLLSTVSTTPPNYEVRHIKRHLSAGNFMPLDSLPIGHAESVAYAFTSGVTYRQGSLTLPYSAAWTTRVQLFGDAAETELLNDTMFTFSATLTTFPSAYTFNVVAETTRVGGKTILPSAIADYISVGGTSEIYSSAATWANAAFSNTTSFSCSVRCNAFSLAAANTSLANPYAARWVVTTEGLQGWEPGGFFARTDWAFFGFRYLPKLKPPVGLAEPGGAFNIARTVPIVDVYSGPTFGGRCTRYTGGLASAATVEVEPHNYGLWQPRDGVFLRGYDDLQGTGAGLSQSKNVGLTWSAI